LEIASLIAAYRGVTSIMNFTNVGQIVSNYACKWSAVAVCLSMSQYVSVCLSTSQYISVCLTMSQYVSVRLSMSQYV